MTCWHFGSWLTFRCLGDNVGTILVTEDNLSYNYFVNEFDQNVKNKFVRYGNTTQNFFVPLQVSNTYIKMVFDVESVLSVFLVKKMFLCDHQ